MPPELYPRLLGDLWARVPLAVRRVHVAGASAGTVEVLRGRGLLAALLGLVLRLPAAAAATPVTLVLSHRDGVQVWHRTFARTRLVTEQFAEDGKLVETFGPFALRFVLRALDDGLELVLEKAFLRLGRLRVPLPRFLAPAVHGVARADGDATRVDVRIVAPVAGTVLRYHGLVRRAEEP